MSNLSSNHHTIGTQEYVSFDLNFNLLSASGTYGVSLTGVSLIRSLIGQNLRD